MIHETEKVSPFDMENEGESLDEYFFIRLKRMEEIYKKKSNKSERLFLQFEALVRINDILQKDLISYWEIKEAIMIYNQTPKGGFYEKMFWNDLFLHLRQLAFVYGREFKWEGDAYLVESKSTTSKAD
ncbi:MAG: hypothetical protein R3E32_19790 [Chitinophagales bacterium]